MEDTREEGMAAYWRASPEVKKVILAHAERRVESQLTALSSLGQRLSAVAALLFAGAALSTSLVTSAKVSGAAVQVAAWAAVTFAARGVIALHGLRSGLTRWSGDRPSWWGESGLEHVEHLDEAGAGYWLAGHYEHSIAEVGLVTKKRALLLNRALNAGAVAGALVAIAALFASYAGNPPSPSPTPATAVTRGDHVVTTAPLRGSGGCSIPLLRSGRET